MRERLGQVALCQSRGGGGYDFNEEEPSELRGKLPERVLRIDPPPSRPMAVPSFRSSAVRFVSRDCLNLVYTVKFLGTFWIRRIYL